MFRYTQDNLLEFDMVNEQRRMNRLLEAMIDLLDIPESYYELAKERARHWRYGCGEMARA